MAGHRPMRTRIREMVDAHSQNKLINPETSARFLLASALTRPR